MPSVPLPPLWDFKVSSKYEDDEEIVLSRVPRVTMHSSPAASGFDLVIEYRHRPVFIMRTGNTDGDPQVEVQVVEDEFPLKLLVDMANECDRLRRRVAVLEAERGQG